MIIDRADVANLVANYAAADMLQTPADTTGEVKNMNYEIWQAPFSTWGKVTGHARVGWARTLQTAQRKARAWNRMFNRAHHDDAQRTYAWHGHEWMVR